MPRELKVTIVEDSAPYLKTLAESLAASLSRDLDLKIIPYLISNDGKPDAALIARQIEQGQPDIIITDYNLINRITGTDLALKIRRIQSSHNGSQHPNTPIICMSAFSNPQEAGIVEKLMDVSGLGGRVFDEVYDKNSDSVFLEEAIKRVAFKPLTVSVEGTGAMGVRIVQELCHSNAVSYVKVHGTHLPPGTLEALCEKNKKLEEVDKFRELEGTDILILAGSNTRGSKVPYLHASPDRRELLPLEMSRYAEYAREMLAFPNMPATMITVNPIAHLMELMRRHGIPPEKLFSPHEPDTTRLCNPLEDEKRITEIIGRIANEEPSLNINEVAEKLSQFLLGTLKRQYITGVHGEPHLVLPDTLRKYESLVGAIREIEKETGEVAKESQEASAKYNLPFYVPQTSIIDSSLNPIAHYRQFPVNCHAYCHFEHNNKTYSGVAAVPTIVTQKGDIKVAPDTEKIKDFSEQGFHETLAPILDVQKAYIDEVLSKK